MSDDEIVLTAEQQQALDEVVAWYNGSRGGFYALTGPAGSGKTTIVEKIIEKVYFGALTAMTGKAALRLAECVPGKDTSTLHSILYYPPEPGSREVRFDKRKLPSSHAIVIDESSMITPQVYSDLLAWVQRGVNILLVGDTFQLPPVITDKKEKEQWGEDFSIFSHVEGSNLTTVMRSVGGVLRAATRVRQEQRICRDPDDGYDFIECGEPLERACSDWLDDRDDHMLVTWRNEVRMNGARFIREELGHGGPLPDPGEPVLIRKNGQGVLNGQVVTCRGWSRGPTIGERGSNPGLPTMWMECEYGKILTVVHGSSNTSDDDGFFDGTMPWIEDWKSYHIDLNRSELPNPIPVTWGYVLTAHAAQGSQARRVTVFLERGDPTSSHFNKMTTLPSGESARFSARWLYTAQTRAKKLATVIVGE